MPWYFYLVFFFLLFFCNYTLYTRRCTLINPFSILSLFYFLPMLLATMRLSYLQAPHWHPETKITLIMSSFVWGIYPFVSLWFKSEKQDLHVTKIYNIQPINVNLILLLSALFTGLFLYENKVLTGMYFPILDHNRSLHGVWVEALPIIRNLTRSVSVVSLLLYVAYGKTKSNIILLLVFFIVFFPATRGSRLNSFIALLCLVIAENDFRVLYTRYNYKKVFLYAIAISTIIFLFISLGDIRGRFGSKTVEYIYSEKIQLVKPSRYLEAFAYFYGYFSIPFENFDRLVIANSHKEKLMGQFSVMPLVGTFLPRFSEDLPQMSTIWRFENPVSPHGVSTALGYFYLDFGCLLSSIPMFFYMYIFLLLYYRSRKRASILWICVYSIYGSHFAMASFQALILNPQVYRKIIILSLFLYFSKILFQLKKRL